MFKQCDTKV